MELVVVLVVGVGVEQLQGTTATIITVLIRITAVIASNKNLLKANQKTETVKLGIDLKTADNRCH